MKSIAFIISFISFSFFGSLLTHLSAQEGLHLRDIQLPCAEKNFNVYVHLSVDSTNREPYLKDNDVEMLMEEVTRYFEPICMSFSSCETNIISNYTFHNIVDARRLEELEILYAKPRRLNVFILGSIPASFCGESTFYGIHKLGGESIFLETSERECQDALSGQLAHHLGHYFGLSDTYRGDQLEIVNHPDCAIRADSICDTPVDPFGILDSGPGSYIQEPEDKIPMSDFVNGQCEFTHKPLDPNGQYYQPQVGNIMAAYPCKCGFTNEQFLKIMENYNKADQKPY